MSQQCYTVLRLPNGCSVFNGHCHCVDCREAKALGLPETWIAEWDGFLRREQEKRKMVVTKNIYIGALSTTFERVGLAFNVYGFEAPSPDLNSQGAYCINIAQQYTANGSLTEKQALAIIWHGLSHSKAQLRQEKEFQLFVKPLDELEQAYSDSLPQED